MGLLRLAADKVAHIFKVRVSRRLRGKLHSVLEKLDRGHRVMRIYCKNLVGRMHEKFGTFLRVEVCVNRMKDPGLNKGLENLGALRKRLTGITDRFAGFEAESLNAHVDFPLFQKIALPVLSGKTKVAGIKIHDTRMMRLMEVLLHGGTGPAGNGWRKYRPHSSQCALRNESSDNTCRSPRSSCRTVRGHPPLFRSGAPLRQLSLTVK